VTDRPPAAATNPANELPFFCAVSGGGNGALTSSQGIFIAEILISFDF
jgi:hypothetical protein